MLGVFLPLPPPLMTSQGRHNHRESRKTCFSRFDHLQVDSYGGDTSPRTTLPHIGRGKSPKLLRSVDMRAAGAVQDLRYNIDWPCTAVVQYSRRDFCARALALGECRPVICRFVVRRFNEGKQLRFSEAKEQNTDKRSAAVGR